jgi:hypothetical protein
MPCLRSALDQILMQGQHANCADFAARGDVAFARRAREPVRCARRNAVRNSRNGLASAGVVYLVGQFTDAPQAAARRINVEDDAADGLVRKRGAEGLREALDAHEPERFTKRAHELQGDADGRLERR